MPTTYTPPPEQATARAILPAQPRDNERGPTTPVTIIFRGGPPIVDMYDQKDIYIPPKPEGVLLPRWRQTSQPSEFFTMQYALALHVKSRAIVPGTRNPHDYQRVVSQIGIVNADKDVDCAPFTAAELKAFGYPNAEGLNRGEFLDSRREVVTMDTKTGLASAYASGRDVEGELEAKPEPDALKPTDHAALHETQATTRAAERAGERVSHTRPGAKFKDSK